MTITNMSKSSLDKLAARIDNKYVHLINITSCLPILHFDRISKNITNKYCLNIQYSSVRKPSNKA